MGPGARDIIRWVHWEGEGRGGEQVAEQRSDMCIGSQDSLLHVQLKVRLSADSITTSAQSAQSYTLEPGVLGWEMYTMWLAGELLTSLIAGGCMASSFVVCMLCACKIWVGKLVGMALLVSIVQYVFSGSD